jgi:beta-N-acetylhexosaminidase
MGTRSLTARQAAGQMMMIGVVGTQVTPQMSHQLYSITPGGVLLFHRNIGSRAEIKRLNELLQRSSQRYAGVPMLIATDQEGGPVVRLNLNFSMPSALAMGEAGDPALAMDLGYRVGLEMKDLGLTMNLAPVLDSLPSSNTPSFIGERAFGRQPQEISSMGLAFASGLESAGIVPTSKHFPGTAKTASDPHLQGAVAETLTPESLRPFADFAKSDGRALMLSHQSISLQGEPPLPGIFSRGLIQKVLRKSLGFRGVVITDDLTMGALKSFGDLPAVATRALEAGADMVILTWGPREQIATLARITQEIESGRLPKKLVQEKLNRLWSLRNLIPARIPSQEAMSLPAIANKINKKIIAKTWGPNESPRIKSFLQGNLFALAQSPEFLSAFHQEFPKAKIQLLPRNWQAENLKFPSDAHLVLVLESPRALREAIKMNPALAKRSLVINESSPYRLDPNLFYSILNIYYKAEGLPTALAERAFADQQSSADPFSILLFNEPFLKLSLSPLEVGKPLAEF